MGAPEVEGNNPLTALSESLAAAVERVGPAVVALDARPRVATSGVIWRAGVVVSTNHTVRRDEEITITLHDGRSLQATLAGRDPFTDLAVLRYESGAAGEEAIAETSGGAGLKVGHLVLAVGRAHPERGASASLGVVALLADGGRRGRGGEIDRLIRPDVSIFIGFSGGALVDTEGRVIGINTTGLARGAGLTVPAATVNPVVDRLLRHGRVARPYLGVGMYHRVALPEKQREKLNLPQRLGLLVISVEADAPAERAGIQLGDILLALDGAPTFDPENVQAILAGREVGTVVRASVLRGGEMREADITLGERPTRGR
jgi:S1-C subfamily serine protease